MQSLDRLPTRRCRCRHVAAAFLLAASGHAMAATATVGLVFDPVAQSGSVGISGRLDSYNFDSLKRNSATFNDSAYGGAGWSALRLGMDINLPDSDCFGQGVAIQSFVAEGGSIRFEGVADVNLSGMASYPYEFQGNGGAFVRLEYTFAVAGLQHVELQMDSVVGRFRDDDYKFLLSSSNGQPVWAATAVLNEEGEADRSFSRVLALTPGVYTITATLDAASLLNGGLNYAGRTQAAFSISAVPEMDSKVMMAMGIMMLILFRKTGGASL